MNFNAFYFFYMMFGSIMCSYIRIWLLEILDWRIPSLDCYVEI